MQTIVIILTGSVEWQVLLLSGMASQMLLLRSLRLAREPFLHEPAPRALKLQQVE
jgi:hypothetical protein